MRPAKASRFSTLAATAVIASFCTFSSAWAIPVLSSNLSNPATAAIETSSPVSAPQSSAQAESKAVKDNLRALIKQVIALVTSKVQGATNKLSSPQQAGNKQGHANNGHWAFQSNNTPIVSDNTPKTGVGVIVPSVVAEQASDVKNVLANNGIDVAQSANGVHPTQSQSPIHGDVTASLPEPGPAILLALGLTGLALARRRTR